MLIISIYRSFHCRTQRAAMSEPLPITTPPRRRIDLLAHVQQAFSSVVSLPSSTSSAAASSSVTHKLTSNRDVSRHLEPFHHALLQSTCHSAKSSPLPHRRLDKLEGVIRGYPASPVLYVAQRHAADEYVDIDSTDTSPAMLRKYPNGSAQRERNFISNHQESPMPYRRSLPHPRLHQPTLASATSSHQHLYRCDDERQGSESKQRHRVDSDCSRSRKPLLFPKKSGGSGKRHVSMSDQFNPVNSIESIHNESLTDVTSSTQLQPDQNIVSGWLKFRDNKRVSRSGVHSIIRTFLVDQTTTSGP